MHTGCNVDAAGSCIKIQNPVIKIQNPVIKIQTPVIIQMPPMTVARASKRLWPVGITA